MTQLLQTAIEVIGAESKKEAIEGGLKEPVHRKNIDLHADAHFNLLAKHTDLKVESFLSSVQKLSAKKSGMV